MNKEFPQLLWGLVALALGLIITGFVVVGGFRDIKKADDTITVTGSAKKSIVSDYVIWRLSVSSSSLNIKTAYSNITASIKAVDSFLAQEGISGADLTSSSIETSSATFTRTDASGNQINEAGYSLSKNYEIRSKDVEKIKAISQKAGALISQGIPLVSSPLEYLYTSLADLRMDLLQAATEDAHRRAEAIAKSAGGGVGAVKSARMGVFQITPKFSTSVDDYGSYDTSSLEKDVTAVVSLDFALR